MAFPPAPPLRSAHSPAAILRRMASQFDPSDQEREAARARDWLRRSAQPVPERFCEQDNAGYTFIESMGADVYPPCRHRPPLLSELTGNSQLHGLSSTLSDIHRSWRLAEDETLTEVCQHGTPVEEGGQNWFGSNMVHHRPRWTLIAPGSATELRKRRVRAASSLPGPRQARAGEIRREVALGPQLSPVATPAPVRSPKAPLVAAGCGLAGAGGGGGSPAASAAHGASGGWAAGGAPAPLSSEALEDPSLSVDGREFLVDPAALVDPTTIGPHGGSFLSTTAPKHWHRVLKRSESLGTLYNFRTRQYRAPAPEA
eukprot:TRINITY_DN32462_c0_g1_i1.p1 TRINITY_DN32462_c0_g1~~TRINITY_DN32462_c0_g1_i1.p1  ORF type:complete len:314 (-),score=57.62 TRINITY_DN32462_c0_g1_i1:102-1043(-)